MLKPVKPKEPPEQKTIIEEYFEERFAGLTMNLEDFTNRIVSLGFLPKDISISFEKGYDYDSFNYATISYKKENIIPDKEYEVIIKRYNEDIKKYKQDLIKFNKNKLLYKFSSREKEVIKELCSSIKLIPSSKQVFLAVAKNKVKNPSEAFIKALSVLDNDVLNSSDEEYLSLLKKKLKT